MQINCNPNDLLYTVGSPFYVIFILITTFGSKHVRNKQLSKYSIAQTTVGRTL